MNEKSRKLRASWTPERRVRQAMLMAEMNKLRTGEEREFSARHLANIKAAQRRRRDLEKLIKAMA